MASMFRASPWVTYQPPAEPQANQEQPVVLQHQLQQPSHIGGTTMIMDMDVDMDAPQISTLHEEKTPPPSKKSAAGRKAKAPKLKVAPAGPSERKGKAATAPQGKAGEDEEDQLIDDDDRSSALAPPTSATPTATTSGRSPDPTPKKKPGPKKKTKKEKADAAAATETSTPSQPMPSDSGSQIMIEGGSASAEPVTVKLSTAGKKKAQAAARKTTSTPRGRGRGAKAKTALVPHIVPADDAAASEAGFTGTAPSSPGTVNMDLGEGSPEPDNGTVAQSSPPQAAAPLPDEVARALEGVAIPQYPLPTKPFPVQAPIKIPTGFAPPMPLDKSTKKVRHWRPANREIRGIGGGRWFVKTWVGEKESDYGSALGEEKAAAAPGGMMGKFSGLSASAPVGRGGGVGRGKGSKLASAAPSAGPSRAGSPGPGPSASAAPRQITKMRILQLAPASENGDSDMAPPES